MRSDRLVGLSECARLARGLLLTVLVTPLIILSGPNPAGAVVHGGGKEFAEPTNPPTIGAQPAPAVEREEADRNVTASYNDLAGSVTVTVEVYDPAHWGGRHPEAEISVGPTCSEPELEGKLFQRVLPTELIGTVTLKNYAGQVESVASYNGQAFSVTFQDANFAGRDWHCFAMSSPQGTETFALGGWPALNPTSDREALLTKLGHGVPSLEKNYVCPAVEIFNGQSGCYAEYFSAGRWHLVEAGVTVRGDEYVVTIYFKRSWHRRWIMNSHSCLKGWGVTGKLETNEGTCEASLIKDVPFELRHHHVPRFLGWDGTDTAGFDPMGLYQCRSRAGVITCSNKLGDAVRYRP